MHKLTTHVTTLAVSVFAGAAVAMPLAKWDDNVLSDDWRISQVMNAQAFALEGTPVGEVHDVLISEAGYIQSLVVRREPAADTNLWTTDTGFVYYEVDWTEAEFRPALAKVVIDKTHSQIQALPHKEVATFQVEGEYEASKLLSLNVGTADAPAYGEIDDLLFSRLDKELTAFIIDAAGSGTHLFAVPADMEAIDYRESVIELSYQADDLDALESFDYGN